MEKIRLSSNKALDLLKDEKTVPELREELLFFLSCLHKDMPGEAYEYFMQFAEKEKTFYRCRRNIAYSVGDASLEWQNNLFKQLIDVAINNADPAMRSTSFEILAIVFWRNKEIISKLNDETAWKILERLKNSLEYHEYNTKGLTEDKKKVAWAGRLSKYLELLLALLRIRTPQNRLLYPRDEKTKWFIDQLNKIQDILKNNNLELRSYIEFDITKPADAADVPDLIYALKLYLSGDDNTNTIIINGVGVDA
jgi:hypothetical protein